jgi:hypothetical protein
MAMLERRTMLRGLASGFAGVAVSKVPAVAHPTSDAHGYAGDQPAQGAAGDPEVPATLLDEHQRAALASLAEMLVPGATAAGVVPLIDRTAALDSQPRQRLLLNAIGAFEHVARSERGGRWVDLDEPDRLAILQSASTAAPAVRKPPAWTRGMPIAVPTSEHAPATIRDHFTYLRTLVADAYFSTEPGMRELGWTGRTIWTALPGCDHPEADHE